MIRYAIILAASFLLAVPMAIASDINPDVPCGGVAFDFIYEQSDGFLGPESDDSSIKSPSASILIPISSKITASAGIRLTSFKWTEYSDVRQDEFIVDRSYKTYHLGVRVYIGGD